MTRAREMRLGLATSEGLYAALCAYLQGSMLREELENRLYHTKGIVNLPASDPCHDRPALPFITASEEPKD